MYILFKDHKGWHWGLSSDPPSRPIASGNSGQNIHMSELTSEILESVVTAYKGGVEIISTEDMLAKWDALNKKNENWSPGGWWNDYEEDDFVTCGVCTGEDPDMPDLCTCQECDQDQYHGDQMDGNMEKETFPDEENIPEGWKVDQPKTDNDENIPEGRKPNRIEEFIKRREKGEIKGQKMRITVKYMKEKRRKKWERNFSWLEEDLDRLIDSRDANPEDLQDFSLPMVLIGSDVTSLYPSLDAKEVAELLYNAVMKTNIKWTNIDYFEATRYIAVN